MASASSPVLFSVPLILLLIFFCSSTAAIASSSSNSSPTQLGASERGKLGGREEIKNVKSNKEIQELGKFSVEEFSKKYHQSQITFIQVVRAQKQVVSGIKYYLSVETTTNGVNKMFNAVVLVKAWLHSKQLLSFTPATATP